MLVTIELECSPLKRMVLTQRSGLMTFSDLSGRAPRLGDRPWLAVGPCDVELATFNGRPSAGLVATDFGAIVFW